jgi:hypothetical protein
MQSMDRLPDLQFFQYAEPFIFSEVGSFQNCSLHSKGIPFRSWRRLMPSGSFPSSICSTIVGDREVSCKIRLTCVRSTLFAAAISSMFLYLPDSSWSCQSQALPIGPSARTQRLCLSGITKSAKPIDRATGRGHPRETCASTPAWHRGCRSCTAGRGEPPWGHLGRPEHRRTWALLRLANIRTGGLRYVR